VRVDPDTAAPGDVALVDLLDRLLAGGVVLMADVVLSLADVDLVRVHLSAIISSVDTLHLPDSQESGSG
jgi:hypothetical protein